ncbi:MAG: hypothetical protein EPO68_17420, partial [Planctomycetota bacterium]
MLSYCPRKSWGTNPTQEMRRADEWMKAIKSGAGPGRSPTSPYPVIARRMRELARDDAAIGAVLRSAPAPVLVPVPRSSLPPPEPYFWPARELSRALVSAGYGTEVMTLLVRVRAVAKRAFGGARDFEEQAGSLGVTAAFPPDQPIVLVDD